MLPELTNYLVENGKDFFPEKTISKKISYLGINGSIEGGTTTLLAFLNKDKNPTFVIRVLRSPQKKDQFLAERDILLSFNKFSSFIKNSVPNLILCKEVAGKWILIESVLRGRPMKVVMDRSGNPSLKKASNNLDLVKDWLVVFNKEAKDPLLNPQIFINGIKEEIREFKSFFPLSEKEEVFLKKIVKTAEIVESQNSFLIHGDFCRQNILVSEGRINIIDWMSAERSDNPLYDFIYFAITYYLQVRKGYGLEGYLDTFKKTFFELNPYSRLIKKSLQEYSKKIELDSSFISLFLALFLIKKSVSEYKNIQSLSKEGFIPRFPIYLGLKRNYKEALKEQIWLYFFRFLVEEENNLIV